MYPCSVAVIGHTARAAPDMLRPQPIPACILAGFCESEWSDGVCPSYASADVKFFVRERRPIPLTQSVLNATAKSGVLVDAAGGELVVLDCVQKGDLLSTTWAALCAVANFDGSAITYRAVRGSLLDQLASKARIDMAAEAAMGIRAGGLPRPGTPGRASPTRSAVGGSLGRVPGMGISTSTSHRGQLRSSEPGQLVSLVRVGVQVYPCSVAVIGHTARAAPPTCCVPPARPRVHGGCVCVCVCCVRGWGRAPSPACVRRVGGCLGQGHLAGHHPRAAQLAAP